jgi:hypothetical protein
MARFIRELGITAETRVLDVGGTPGFNWLYLQVTRAVEARVAANGFQDPEWLAALDVQFAGLYFGALKAALSGVGSVPDCWQVLFDRRGDFAVARIQFALAGINAHINHDLPEAIVATGCAPAHGCGHYTDYTAVNGTLDSLVEGAKTTLHVRLPGDALPPVSHLEDTIAAFSVGIRMRRALPLFAAAISHRAKSRIIPISSVFLCDLLPMLGKRRPGLRAAIRDGR